jgi:hypothetical protein
MGKGVLLVCVVIVLAAAAVSAQWINYPDPRIPRDTDGTPILSAPAPRAWDGKPDLTGVWHVSSESIEEKQKLFGPEVGRNYVPGMEPFTTSKYSRDMLLDFKPGEIVLTPEGQTAFERNKAPGAGLLERCLPVGIPTAVLLSEVQKIVQAPGEIVVMHELDGGMTRQIYTDGRPLPKDPVPSWQGYSIGRWDGETLVVETIGFNGKAAIDGLGRPRSEAMMITERMHRRDVGHLDVEMTFDDPKYYNKPFTVKLTHLLQPDTDILEYVCNENEKDREHMVRQ